MPLYCAMFPPLVYIKSSQREIFPVRPGKVRSTPGRGSGPLQLLRYAAQSQARGRTLFESVCSSCALLVGFNSLSDFCLLQVQCASCRLSMSLGWPPFATGMMWSIHGDNGCGYLLSKSTGLPQMPQHVCVAYIFFLFRSKARRWVPSLSGLLRLVAMQ